MTEVPLMSPICLLYRCKEKEEELETEAEAAMAETAKAETEAARAVGKQVTSPLVTVPEGEHVHVTGALHC